MSTQTESQPTTEQTFEGFKQEIIRRIKKAGACEGEFHRVTNAENIIELFDIGAENSGWLEDHNIYDGLEIFIPVKDSNGVTIVYKNVDLRGTQITALPDGLSVGGSLYLSGTQITALPDGLSVGGSLYLRGTQITALPDGLSVGGSLDLSGTQITALPDGLSVREYIYAQNCTLVSIPKHLKEKIVR